MINDEEETLTLSLPCILVVLPDITVPFGQKLSVCSNQIYLVPMKWTKEENKWHSLI